jgi:hypothetical protein
LTFRDDDEELFDMNHVEYIRRDIEGSDGDTRRKSASELVRFVFPNPNPGTHCFTSNAGHGSDRLR